MKIAPTPKTAKRRGSELSAAANACADEDSAGLLLFYAAECLLKALYMRQNGLQNTDHATLAAGPARQFVHRLDSLIRAIKIPPKDLKPSPGDISLRGGGAINVDQLHQAWRYGEKVAEHQPACAWLRAVIAYAQARL